MKPALDGIRETELAQVQSCNIVLPFRVFRLWKKNVGLLGPAWQIHSPTGHAFGIASFHRLKSVVCYVVQRNLRIRALRAVAPL